MNRVKIKLNTIEKVKEFATIVTRYKSDIDLYKDNPKNRVDAKSLLAIFVLDLNSELTVEINTSNEDELVNFLNDMKGFEV